jgi:DNA-3-methyladenine glycosylase
MRPLPRSFAARASPVVARDLLGRLLVKTLDDRSAAVAGDPGLLVGRIVETEAYQEDDPASHSFGGPRGRNLVMFGPPGRLYVYFTYGMHFCMNLVTGAEGTGSAVLLRAVEPLHGLEEMAWRRGVADPRRLCSGPARLTQAFGVDRTQDGLELGLSSGLWLAAGQAVDDDVVAAGPRVGIRLAKERPWRFAIRGSAFVSKPAPAGRLGEVRASTAGRPPR